jgi:hypothetical protein
VPWRIDPLAHLSVSASLSGVIAGSSAIDGYDLAKLDPVRPEPYPSGCDVGFPLTALCAVHGPQVQPKS